MPSKILNWQCIEISSDYHILECDTYMRRVTDRTYVSIVLMDLLKTSVFVDLKKKNSETVICLFSNNYDSSSIFLCYKFCIKLANSRLKKTCKMTLI